MKKIILIFLVLACACNIYAQTRNDTLKTLLAGKTKYLEIESIVTDFYSTRFKGKGSGYNQWLRWLHFNRDRVEPNGDVTNISEKTEMALSTSASSNFSNATESMTTWSNIGPLNYTSLLSDYLWGLGRIDRITFHPTNANIFFVGTAAGGLWKTTTGGTSWVCLTEELFTPGIAGIVCSYADPNTLYVLTGEGEGTYGYFNYMGAGQSTGVYKSTNGGVTWTKTGKLFDDNQYIAFQLIQHPTKPNVLYAATSEGLYATADGGDHWARSTIWETRDVCFHPERPEFIYVDEVTEVLGYLCSNDTAMTPLNSSGPHNGSFVAMAVSPNEPNTVMMMASKAHANGDDFKALYKGVFTYNAVSPWLSSLSFSTVITSPNILGSAVNGSTAGSQAWYDMCMALKPSDANTLITGGMCVWRSTAQGTGIAALTKYADYQAELLPYIHPDVHRVTYNPLNDYLYACTDGGIYKSTDDGTTWTDISAGMSITQYYNISGVESNANLIMGGTQDNGTFYRKTNTTNYRRVRGADGFSTAINPNNTNKIYWTENNSLNRSINGGDNVSTIRNFAGGFNEGLFPEVRLNMNKPDTIAAFTKDVVVLSKNAGNTWDTIHVNTTIRDFSFCGDNNSKAYLVRNTESLRVCDNIFAASPVWVIKPSLPSTYSTVISFPTYSNWVWMGASGYSATNKVVFSENGGDTWFDRTGSLPNLPINCMAVDNSATLYVGTDIGVFIRKIGDVDWSPYSNGLPRVPVTEIVINNTSGLLRIATQGRGVWSTNVVDAANCNFSQSVTGNYYGQYYFQASNNINATGIVAGSAGTKVDLKAGSYIIMNPGFVANKGSVLTTAIGPCNSGIPGLQKEDKKTSTPNNKTDKPREN